MVVRKFDVKLKNGNLGKNIEFCIMNDENHIELCIMNGGNHIELYITSGEITLSMLLINIPIK